MQELLVQMVERGFAPLDNPRDARAELLNKQHVAGVVASAATVIGLPRSVWGDAAFGLVPTCHAARLIIAACLPR